MSEPECIAELAPSLDTFPPPAHTSWRGSTAKLVQDYLTAQLNARAVEPDVAKGVALSLVEKLRATEADCPTCVYRALVETAHEFSALDEGLSRVRGDFFGLLATSHHQQARAALIGGDVGRALEVVASFRELLRGEQGTVEGLTRAAQLMNDRDAEVILGEHIEVRRPLGEEGDRLADLLREAVCLSVGGKVALMKVFEVAPERCVGVAEALMAERARLDELAVANSLAVAELRLRHRRDWDAARSMRSISDAVRREYDRVAEGIRELISPLTDETDVERLRVLPLTIYNQLREVAVAQEEALRVTAVTCFEHHLRANGKIRPENPKPTVILFVGPSGCGKTFIAKNAGRCLNLPFAHVNAANLVGSGIVGTTLSDTLDQLTALCDGDVDKASRGVLFIDEVDKLMRGGDERSLHYANSIQCELLMFLEGEKVLVPRNSKRERDGYYFDTSNLLILLGGAFEGVEEIVARRLGHDGTIGFTAGAEVAPRGASRSFYAEVTKDDIVEYGFLPQLMGRVPRTANLLPLSKEHLLAILRNPRCSPLQTHRDYFAATGDQLVVDDDVLELVAGLAADSKFGARHLVDLVDGLLFDLKFVAANLIHERVHLTREFAERHLCPSLAGANPRSRESGSVRRSSPG